MARDDVAALKLLRHHLSEDSSIRVLIDDNEGHSLKVIMDKVLGRRNGRDMCAQMQNKVGGVQ